MYINIEINSCIDIIYYFGCNLLVGINNKFLILNKYEKLIFECIRKGIKTDVLAQKLKKEYGISENIEQIKEIVIDYIMNSNTGKKLYCMNTITHNQERGIKIIGVENNYYPKYLQIELTKRCNLKCPHCYKVANDEKCINQNIDKEKLFGLSNFIGDNIITIGFTGGEPLLHPEFNEIVNHFSKKARLELNTNGILLEKMPAKILRLFDAISISLYGLSESEYKENTQNSSAFYKLKKSCEYIKKLGIRFNISVIVTKKKITQLEEYTRLAIELGATTLQFGTANAIGRGKELATEDSSWFLNNHEKRVLYREIRTLINRYKDKISILEWSRDQYEKGCEFGLAEIYKHDAMSCGAGTIEWAVNEQLEFRPCVICPEIECINFTYEEWKQYVLGNNVINWQERLKRFESYCIHNDCTLIEYCNRFEELLDKRRVK